MSNYGIKRHLMSRTAWIAGRRSRTRLAIVVIALLVAAATSACGSSSGSSGSGGSSGGKNAPYVVGADTSLSGALAFLGDPLKSGAAAYYSYINGHGGVNGHPIKLIALDDNSGDTTTALTAARQLVEQDHALALTGWILTNVESAIQPYAAREGVTMLARGCDPTIATTSNKVVFCGDPAEADEATPEVQFAKTKVGGGPVKVAVLDIDSVAQQQLQKKIVAEAQANGWQVVLKQLVATDTTDMSAQAAAVQHSGATIVIGSLDSERIQLFDKSLRVLGSKIPIVNFDGGASQQVLGTLKDPLLYTLSGYAFPTDPTPGVKQYDAQMKKTGGNPGEQDAMDGYVEGEVVAAALKKCGWPCSTSKFTQSMTQLGTVNTNGLTVSPLKYSSSYFLGITGGRFYAWSPGQKRAVPVSGVIPVT